MFSENVIFVFPGQGVQYIGMGKDLFKNFACVRYTFEQVSDIAHKNVAKFCFDGPSSYLNRPDIMNTLPTIYCNILFLIVVKHIKGDFANSCP